MQPRAADSPEEEDSPGAETETEPEVLRVVRFRSKAEVAALVASVEGTVRECARRYGYTLAADAREDLLAAGRLGAVDAAARYDPARGASFNTYATHWIRVRVLQQVAHFWGRGRVGGASMSPSARKVFFGQGRARRAIEGRGEEATHAAVAAELGVDEWILRAVVVAVSDSGVPRDEDGEALVDAISEEACPEATAVARGTYAVAVEAMADLDDRSRHVVEQRYLLGRSLEEVGEEIGLTRERVRQIEGIALRRLRSILESS